MAITYDVAEMLIVELMWQIKMDHHKILERLAVKIDVLMVTKKDKAGHLEPTLKLHGKWCAATIEIVNLKHRSLGQGDALLIIDEYHWDGFSVKEKAAVLDHELTHLQVQDESGKGGVCRLVDDKIIGIAAMDDQGRPKLSIREHDWELSGFTEVVQRHGAVAIEAQAARKCERDVGGYLWDFMSAEDVKSVSVKIATAQYSAILDTPAKIAAAAPVDSKKTWTAKS